MLAKEFHTHSNSAILQRRHRRLYEELYHACPTVVSAPATLLWSPTYAVGPGGIGIASKLPLRLYVGVEPLSTPGLEFGPGRYFIPERDEFQEWDVTRGHPLILRILELAMKQYSKTGGARIWCISEVPWYRGLNVDQLYAVALAVAWLTHLGVLTPGEVEELTRAPTDKLTGSNVFERVFRLAWKLGSVIEAGLADAHLSFASLIDSQYPVVFFRERDPFLFDHFRDYGLEHSSSYYNVSDGLFYRGVRMDELFPLDPNPVWPIDVALVFTGEEGDSRFVYQQTRGAFKAKLDEAAAVSNQVFPKLLPETFRRPPRFLELIKESPGQSAGMNLFYAYRDTSVVHSISIFKSLRDLFLYGATPEVLNDFLHNQNVCQDILRVLGLSPLSISRPRTLFRMVGKRHTDAGVASRLVGPGNLGCFMVLGPADTLAGVLTEVLPIIKKETNNKVVHCHFASWCDGNTASSGARIEQYVEAGIYSSFTNAESITVRQWNGGEAAPALLYTADKWAQEREAFDLLLDGQEGKVLVRGMPLTSNDIHSAKQTIELFRQFFKKGKGELTSEELPSSCYRADRNQMESKITRPLVGILKDWTGKPLGLEVHGSLGSNFMIKFQPPKFLRVGFVEKK